MAKILIVEDDTNLSEIYQARMEAEGYIVITAPDGESALALAAKEKPDLIISDVMMPKISGFEMLDILRNTQGLKHTKVIMLTALGQAEDRTRAESLGADKYLVKSQVTLEDIVSAAQELLGDGDVPLPASVEQASPTAAAGTTAATPAASDATTIPAASSAAAAADSTAPTQATTTDPVQPAPTGPLPITTPAAAASATPAATAGSTPSSAGSDNDARGTISTSSTSSASATTPAGTNVSVQPSAQAPQPTPALQTAAPAVALAPPTPSTSTPPTPSMPATTAAAATAPAPSLTANPIDEQVVANAIDKLLAKSPAASAEQKSSADIAPGQSPERQHKKVITPPDHTNAPSLQDLLAQEEAKDTGTVVSPSAASADTAPTPNVAPAQVSAIPTNTTDTDEQDAAAILAKAQAVKGEKAAQSQQGTQDGTGGSSADSSTSSNTNSTEFDPNSISL